MPDTAPNGGQDRVPTTAAPYPAYQPGEYTLTVEPLDGTGPCEGNIPATDTTPRRWCREPAGFIVRLSGFEESESWATCAECAVAIVQQELPRIREAADADR